MTSSYDRVLAKRALDEFRTKRRSATPDMVARLCRALGYEIDKKRGKGSHRVANRAGAVPVTIPRVFGVKIATGILRTLEEVFEQDGTH